MKHWVHFPFSKNHTIITYSIDVLKGKCTEGLLHHVGAHLKAPDILVWILGPESITARVLLCQSWLQCGEYILSCGPCFFNNSFIATIVLSKVPRFASLWILPNIFLLAQEKMFR